MYYTFLKILLVSFSFIILPKQIFPQWSTDPNNNLIIGYGQDPQICSDSAGGCYVTYDYESLSYPRKLALERLDKFGYKPLGDKKQIPGELEQQSMAEIVEDGEGGVIISYEDNEWIPPYYFKTRVRVQKVDSSGNFLWGQTGVRVTLSETNHGGQKLISDGNGGCIVAWGDTLNEYRINRINNLGQRLWGDSGKVIESNSNGYPLLLSKLNENNFAFNYGRILYGINLQGDFKYRDSLQYRLADIANDDYGGVVASWYGGSASNIKIVSQRKDSLGNNLWQEPYVEIADSLGFGSLNIGVNKSTINYAWLGTFNGQSARPFMQSVGLDGNILFPNKILLSNDTSGTAIIGIIPSNLQKTIYCWSIASEANSIFAQMYDTLGNKLWNENGVKVAHPRMTYQKYTTDNRGGFIIAGLIDNFTVLVQQVSRNGNLGEIITAVDEKFESILPSANALHQNYPNPFNSSTIIKYQVQKEGRIKINLYNVLGEKIKTLFEGERSGGTYKINFSSDKLPSGNYFYSLEDNSFREVKKLTILK